MCSRWTDVRWPRLSMERGRRHLAQTSSAVRPNVLAYPSATTARYLIFAAALSAVACSLATGCTTTYAGDEWARTISACGSRGHPAVGDPRRLRTRRPGDPRARASDRVHERRRAHPRSVHLRRCGPHAGCVSHAVPPDPDSGRAAPSASPAGAEARRRRREVHRAGRTSEREHEGATQDRSRRRNATPSATASR